MSFRGSEFIIADPKTCHVDKSLCGIKGIPTLKYLHSSPIFPIFTPIRHRINNQITAPELRVIDESGKNLGVLSREEALKLVRPGLDLIEITANANPPVARIMSYDKFRYMEAKAEKKERQGQKTGGTKQVQVSARAAEHDLMVKAKQAEKFLNEGHQVEIQMRLRGREKGMKAWAEEKLREFLKMIPVEYKMLYPIKFGGRGLGTYIAKTNEKKP